MCISCKWSCRFEEVNACVKSKWQPQWTVDKCVPHFFIILKENSWFCFLYVVLIYKQLSPMYHCSPVKIIVLCVCYEKYIVVSTAECEFSVYSGNRLSGCPDSFTVWRAGGTLETSLLLCAVCFSLHLFWLHSTWIIMHYPPVCTPAQVIREYMSGEEKRRQGFNYYCNYCTSGVTNWSISYGKWKEK